MASSESSFYTTNPATGEKIKTFHRPSWSEAEKAVHKAEEDFQWWRKKSFSERSQVLKDLAKELRAQKEDLATCMHLEMGKLQSEALAEIEKCAKTCEFYADAAEGLLKNQKVEKSPYDQAEISFQPLGVILSVMPWNFPLWQALRFAAPALMAGNVIVMKHSDLTAGTAELLDQIFSKLTDSRRLLKVLHMDHEMTAKVMAEKSIRGVTFTGSTTGGKKVAQTAAENLKKTVLELGGSDAYIVLEDADLNKAAEVSAKSRLQNCGQSCVAGKRFIVTQKNAEAFTKKMIAEMQKADLAPLAAKKFQKSIHEQVQKLEAWGGKILLGGKLPEGSGAYYPATLVYFEKDRPEIHNEEVFGPVALVLAVADEAAAIKAANSSVFGLGGGVFTKDLEKGRRLVESEMEAGFVVVNDFVKSDPHLPFGGVKDSGYGRELSPYGLLEFVNIKTVAVAGG